MVWSVLVVIKWIIMASFQEFRYRSSWLVMIIHFINTVCGLLSDLICENAVIALLINQKIAWNACG